MSSTIVPPSEEAGKDDVQKPLKKIWEIPLLRLRVNDVSSKGSAAYFAHINTTTMLKEAVIGVLDRLYTPETVPTKYDNPAYWITDS